MDPFYYELIGYAASVLVAISLVMSSILRLRIINLVGSALFTVYGLLIRAYPIAVVNFIIVLINLYYLYEMLRKREYFTLLEVQPDSDYLRAFVNFYEKEIRRFLPDFHYQPAADQVAFFVLRNMVPAGLFIGRRDQTDRLVTVLDFVIPGYRDFKIGQYVFGPQAGFFRQRGIHTICSAPGNPAHESYLKRMGFERPPGEGSYLLQVGAGEEPA